jgi:hypothetical protein
MTHLKLTTITLWCALITCALHFCNANAEDKTIEVTYTGTDSVNIKDDRNLYFIELLTQALARTGKNYHVFMSIRGATHARQMQMVVDGMIDVLWDAPSPEVDKRLTAIEIPIDKGLIGWRLFFINKEDQALFSTINSAEELKKIPLGQVKYWHDTAILKADDLNVIETPNYLGTFKMLTSKRFKYFPRSLAEIWQEQDDQAALLKDVVIEKTLVLQYPIAYYYHVNANNKSLAHDIKMGLEMMLNDGSFDKLFQIYNGKYIELAKLSQRRVIKIDNPFMTPATYQKFEKFWFNPVTLNSSNQSAN